MGEVLEKFDKICKATGCPSLPLSALVPIVVGLTVTLCMVFLTEKQYWGTYMWMPWVFPQQIFWWIFWSFQWNSITGVNQGLCLQLGVTGSVGDRAFWGLIYPCCRYEVEPCIHVCRLGNNGV